MGLQKNPLIGTVVETGDRFPATGYYSFAGHKDDVGDECFVSPQVKFGMLFERGGDRVPHLVACTHVVRWKLDAVY